jgi:hypothetical protein
LNAQGPKRVPRRQWIPSLSWGLAMAGIGGEMKWVVSMCVLVPIVSRAKKA